MSDTKNWSFTELELKRNVPSRDLVLALQQYAHDGWSISSRVVIELIRRASLSDLDRQNLLASAREGVEVQTHQRDTKDAREYQKVIDHLSS